MSGFALKLIALISMILDHTGAALFPNIPWLRMIGRVAFPIYIFLIAEGLSHTRSVGKYSLRLFLFALISEIPYDVALYLRPGFVSPFAWGHQNVFLTLCLGVLAVWGFRGLRKAGVPYVIAALTVAPCAAAAHLMNTDYGWLGVVAIFACALMPNKWSRMVAVACLVVVQYWGGITYLAFALLALPPIALYNGKRGPRLRIAFYAAYPAHLAALACMKLLIR